MIIKDDSEVKGLQKALISAIDHVDSVHIVANGKEVGQIESLIKFTQEKFPKKLVTYDYLAWNNDFSEQRNYSFSKAPKDTDYIFWMDADDVLVGGEHLRIVAEIGKKTDHDVLFLKYWYGCEFDGEPTEDNLKEIQVEHYRERLIKPGTIEWKKRIHETPVPVSGQKDRYSKIPYNKEHPIAIMHTSGLDDAVDKLDRNRNLLELELEDERKSGQPDPRTILYLMKIYAETGDEETLRKCIEMGYEYLSLSGWDEERSNACDIMAICHTKLGEYDRAVNLLHEAIEEFPLDPLHYVRLALSYFNLGKYRQSKHWLEIAGNMDLDDSSAGVKSIKELKVLFAQALLKLKYNAEKDLKGALEAAQLLYEEQPIPENKENLDYIQSKVDLYDASENSKKLIDYLESVGDRSIIEILDTLPGYIINQPWAIQKRRQHTPPRIWGENEICYFANFNSKHFEKWDGNSDKKGIGGSETAVINLAKQWTELGYKVTVYGDPVEPYEIDGVTYLPWFYFNKADKFNVFIQWRSPYLAPVIKCKKFIVDLHDVVAQVDYSDKIMAAVDKIMFKSKYHRDMLPELPESKALVISNGIHV